VIVDEASYCWPVRTVLPMWCFYGPVRMDRAWRGLCHFFDDSIMRW